MEATSTNLLSCIELMSAEDLRGLTGHVMLLIAFHDNPDMMREFWANMAMTRQADCAALLAAFLTTGTRVTTPRHAKLCPGPECTEAPRKPGGVRVANVDVRPVRLW